MKKKSAILLLAACMLTACMLTACSKKNAVITTGNKPLSEPAYHNDSVSLAPYTGLKAEKKVYQVTDEAAKDAIKEALDEFIEYESVSRASKEGDWVYTDYTASINWRTVDEQEDYYFTLGEMEYGSEFDQHLTGVTSGDELSFSISYDPFYVDSGWAGKTVDFEVRVTDVKEEILPDADDSFIKENTEYESYAEFAAAVRESVADQYETESTDELQEELLKQVIDASSILQYTQAEYDAAKAEIENAYMGYADIFASDLDSIYEMLEMTDEDVEQEIQETLYRTIVVNAIIENEHLTLSDADYEEGIAYYMKQNAYEDKDEFMSDYGEDEVRRQLTEDMALNFLVNHADITEVEAEYEED